jgi:hypothetical protein
MPLGLRLTHLDPDVVVTFEDWHGVNGVRLFRKASFIQGDDVFTHRYTAIELDAVPDTAFTSPRHLNQSTPPR